MVLDVKFVGLGMEKGYLAKDSKSNFETYHEQALLLIRTKDCLLRLPQVRMSFTWH